MTGTIPEDLRPNGENSYNLGLDFRLPAERRGWGGRGSTSPV